MSCLDDSDDHLRWLAPTDLNLDYMGITHLDCVNTDAHIATLIITVQFHNLTGIGKLGKFCTTN